MLREDRQLAMHLFQQALKLRPIGVVAHAENSDMRGQRFAPRELPATPLSPQAGCFPSCRFMSSPQNRNFNANWISRPFIRVLRITPNCAVPAVIFGSPKEAWFKALKNSARNCSVPGSRFGSGNSRVLHGCQIHGDQAGPNDHAIAGIAERAECMIRKAGGIEPAIQ